MGTQASLSPFVKRLTLPAAAAEDDDADEDVDDSAEKPSTPSASFPFVLVLPSLLFLLVERSSLAADADDAA